MFLFICDKIVGRVFIVIVYSNNKTNHTQTIFKCFFAYIWNKDHLMHLPRLEYFKNNKWHIFSLWITWMGRGISTWIFQCNDVKLNHMHQISSPVIVRVVKSLLQKHLILVLSRHGHSGVPTLSFSIILCDFPNQIVALIESKYCYVTGGYNVMYCVFCTCRLLIVHLIYIVDRLNAVNSEVSSNWISKRECFPAVSSCLLIRCLCF